MVTTTFREIRFKQDSLDRIEKINEIVADYYAREGFMESTTFPYAEAAERKTVDMWAHDGVRLRCKWDGFASSLAWDAPALAAWVRAREPVAVAMILAEHLRERRRVLRMNRRERALRAEQRRAS